MSKTIVVSGGTDGMGRAFALERLAQLYYLSRYLLSQRLTPLLERSATPVIVSIAGVGVTKGAINWDDPQLTHGYSAIRAQLQAGRANDLLGVTYDETAGNTVRFVLYHPGFTRSGDLSSLNAVTRTLLRILARISAQPISAAIHPIHAFVDAPPAQPLTALDRGHLLPLSLPTLDPANAHRLATLTETLLSRADT
ncbi:hypothetical protein [Nocardia sp. NPDC006630]|uniref:hypothetical protein n=1 Tax=Nocardia sp. NPDC006630 TaxID=3157181 RepID=UPI0033AB410D